MLIDKYLDMAKNHDLLQAIENSYRLGSSVNNCYTSENRNSEFLFS
jgi:hypothetical protein